MNVTQFEHMIEQSGLHHIFTIASQLRFLVSYRHAGQFGTLSLGDTLAFGRDEFLAMTEAEAKSHIDACKARLEHAARLKTPTWLYYPEHVNQQREGVAPPKKRRTHAKVATTINYPAH